MALHTRSVLISAKSPDISNLINQFTTTSGKQLDETVSVQSLQDLNLNSGQRNSVDSLISQIVELKETRGSINLEGRRRIINGFLNAEDSMTPLTDDRRQAVRKLLEAAFN